MMMKAILTTVWKWLASTFINTKKLKKPETDSVMDDEQKSVYIIYFGEQFWKPMNEARMQTLLQTLGMASNAYVFIMTASDAERDEAIERCKRFIKRPIPNVISPTSDKTTFYETFYEVLEKNLQTFSSDLKTRISTRRIYALTSKLGSLIEELQSRKASMKSPLTEQCLEIIKASRENGVVGYRLLGNELHIYENEHLGNETARRSEIENSIIENFNGQVHFRLLNNVLKPQYAVKCGDYIENNELSLVGTLGMFGEMKNTPRRNLIQTVALSTPHLFSSGDIAFSLNEKRIGECIWPENKNIYDVSILKIEPAVINSLKQTIFNEQIKIESIPKNDLLKRQVFKYGATSKHTSGFINQVDYFELFDTDVMAISSEDSEPIFSKSGDSGAIVLTKFDGQCHGIGVLYGEMDTEFIRENKKIKTKESIAIFLKDALDKFSSEKHMTIEFDKI